MKTTVEIADGLLAEAKKTAKERDITLRELIECGLRKELRERGRTAGRRVWPDLSITGRLLEPFSWDDWAAIKEEGRRRGSDA